MPPLRRQREAKGTEWRQMAPGTLQLMENKGAYHLKWLAVELHSRTGKKKAKSAQTDLTWPHFHRYCLFFPANWWSVATLHRTSQPVLSSQQRLLTSGLRHTSVTRSILKTFSLWYLWWWSDQWSFTLLLQTHYDSLKAQMMVSIF